jgi:hypothetical protein
MKRSLGFVVLLGLIFTMLFTVNSMAAANDSTKFITDYTRTGVQADGMVKDILDHNGPASNILRKRIYTTPIFVPATNDSISYTMIEVPPHQSFYIDSLYYGCRTEPNVSTTKVITLTILCYDSSAATLDTVVDYRTIDADSGVFNNTATLLTFNSTSFQTTHKIDPGDIVWAQVRVDTAGVVTGRGMFVSMKGRVAEF